MSQLTSKGNSESDFSLCLCFEKSLGMIFSYLYSKMVRKVKLIHVIFYYIGFKTAPEKRRFPWLGSQNKPSLSWYKIRSWNWKRNVTQADQQLFIYGRKSTFLSRRYFSWFMTGVNVPNPVTLKWYQSVWCQDSEGWGWGDPLIKVGTDVRRVQNLSRAKFPQNPNARAKKCPKT